jgi:hypothetical protein
MNIPNYTYIAHKLIKREWGNCLRYTVANAVTHFNNEIPINDNPTEQDLIDAISIDLVLMDVVREEVVDPRQAEISKAVSDAIAVKDLEISKTVSDAVIAKEAEITGILETKGLLAKGEKIINIKTVDEILLSKPIVEVM